MCGHGTIGVATVLVETGMVEVTEPVTTIRLDTPAGLVVAEVAVRRRRAPSAVTHPQRAVVPDRARRRRSTCPGFGEVRYDLAFGGNFYAIVELEELGAPVRPGARPRAASTPAWPSWTRSTRPSRPVHPDEPGIAGCHHVYLVAPGLDAPTHSRHAMAIHPGWFDRSPCGTGTCARMAQLHARGELPLDEDFVNESFIGTRVHRPARRGDHGGRARRRRARRSPAAPGSPARPSTCSTRPTRSPPASCLAEVCKTH